jgi:hypothetical protein
MCSLNDACVTETMVCLYENENYERKRGEVKVQKDKLACHPLEGFLD